MKLPHDYYHCFLGNGLDAVLIGYTGAMVSDKVGVDRCAWYKSDRYYPEDKLVKVAGRFPIDKPLEHAEGSGWFEIAPLGRMWYEILDRGSPTEVQASIQKFEPQEGTLYSWVEIGKLNFKVTTFLHATKSILVVHIDASTEIKLRAWMAPGVWVTDGWDTDPFRSVKMDSHAAQGWYDLGETQGRMALETDPAPGSFGADELARSLDVSGRRITLYFSITDDRQGDDPRSTDFTHLQEALFLGYERLLNEHQEFWRSYFSVSSVCLPDEQYQHFYQASMYHFKGMQNPVSGGLPVNNLRRTWSSHLFWDSYYIQRALLEANHLTESLEACRFFQRTQDAARRHAREEFNCEGMKWDWEITHDGRKAYGVLLHMKDQVHNNASYANEIFQYYQFTHDLDYLREFYPILEGLARFFLCNVIESNDGIYNTRPVVGVDENPIRVINDGITVAGSVVILRHTCQAASLLEVDNDFTRRCAQVADGLLKTLGKLYNGRYFVPSLAATNINMSSFGPIYPMQVIPFDDPRSLSTAMVCFDQQLKKKHSPWAAGVLATILANQGRVDQAWQLLDTVRPMMCQFGGLTEVMEAGKWNMQYFGTAQGAVCTALHSLLLQEKGNTIKIFPAVPSQWDNVSFSHLLGGGCSVSASFRSSGGKIEGSLKNITDKQLAFNLKVGNEIKSVQLLPEEEYGFHATR